MSDNLPSKNEDSQSFVHFKSGKIERNKQICEMRKNGASYVEIASLFNVSGNRIRQIYETHRHREQTDLPLKRLISPMLRNAFFRVYGDDRLLENPQQIIDEFKFSDLKKVQNVGIKSIHGLVNALITLGYLKECDEWLQR